MRRFASFAILALSFVAGCAYMNGDAMWLGKEQKSVSVSNALMTLNDTKYAFEAENLPFEFTCKPSKCPYLFGVDLQTNSVFKVRFAEHFDPKDDEYVEIRNGVARIHKRDKSGWILSSKDVGTEISRCDGANFIMSTEAWWFYACTTNADGSRAEDWHVTGKFSPCKMITTRRFVIEECQNVIFHHQSNWYDWGCN